MVGGIQSSLIRAHWYLGQVPRSGTSGEVPQSKIDLISSKNGGPEAKLEKLGGWTNLLPFGNPETYSFN